MEIIFANHNDIDTIVNLSHKIWNEYYITILSKNQIDYMLDLMYNKKQIAFELDNDFTWLLIKQDNDFIGYASYSILNNKKYKLHKIYIYPNLHGKGYGSQLLNFIIDDIKSKGGNKLSLNVNKYNTKSIKFYEKNGFKIVDDVVVDIGNGFVMDDYIMEKDLI